MAPATVPMPPCDRGAADERRGDGVQFEAGAAGRLGGVQPGGEHEAGQCGEDAHVHEEPEGDGLGLDAGQLRGVQVAADGVGVPAEDAVVHQGRVDDHQDRQHDQDDRGAPVAGEQEGDGQHEQGDERGLGGEPGHRFVLEVELLADPAFLDRLDQQRQGGADAQDDRQPLQHRGAAGDVRQEAAAQRPQFGRGTG